MHSFTSKASDPYTLLVRVLPRESISAVWNRMSGSTMSKLPWAPECTFDLGVGEPGLERHLPALREPAQHLRLQVGAGAVDVTHVGGSGFTTRAVLWFCRIQDLVA